MFPWLSAALDELDDAGLRRGRRTVTPLTGGRCRVGDRECWNLTTNDYLNLADDPRLTAAAREALDDGTGARASALVSGRTPWHERLERRIATFEGTESSLLFPSGYAANVGTLAALADSPDDVLFCDRLNHASLVDGCRLAAGKLRVYRHDRLEELDRALAQTTGARRRFLVTDAVFSMDGDTAPLTDLCDIAERHDAAVVVDEAHATGVLGEHGRGLCEAVGVEDRVGVRIGTLSKAVGTLGGFVAGSQELIDWLWNRARTQIYSTALPPAICAAATTAFDVIEERPERRTRVLELAQRLRQVLPGGGGNPEEGDPNHSSLVTPIVPVIVGEADRTMLVTEMLAERGFLVAGIRPPTVPRGTSRLRVSLACALDTAVVEELATAVTETLELTEAVA